MKDNSAATQTSTHPRLRLPLQLDSKVFVASLVAYVILFAPIILAGRYLLDDMRRSIWGYFGWGLVGRPLGDNLFYLVNLGSPAVSTYLLNQLMAICCLAASGTILATLIKVRNPVLAALALLPLGGHPYFLENISYSFDSVLMAAAVLAAIAAAGVAIAFRGAGSSVVAVAFLGGSLCLYQPAANLFFLVCAFFLAKSLLKSDGHQASASVILWRSVGATIGAGLMYYGMVYYRFQQSQHIGDYAAQHAALPTIAEAHSLIMTNLFTYWNIIWSDWRKTPVIVLIGLVSAIGLIALYLDWPCLQPRAGFGITCLSFSLLGVAFVLQYGLLLALKDPIWSPRTFMTFGVLPALAGLQALSTIESMKARTSRAAFLVFVLVVIGLSYSLLVVAHATGAAVLAQKEFETSLTSRIIMDIEQLQGIEKVAIVGTAPSSPILLNTARKFPIVPRVVQNPMINDWYWGYVLLKLNGVSVERAFGYADKVEGRHPTLMRRSYSIFVLDKTAIIDFRKVTAGDLRPAIAVVEPLDVERF